ncbi:hypothetical protein AJ80_03830 [Polytolypa hystricis UAMH7299]|uniref:Major facilitator superfamily (MFS) profile domain-containing protein n=1 Tax=Polytolypa hystricis (strain UAMH7299) TaxID=1447883 RepID=A0A2B7YEH3_POLH7|nr:hypothetical protein AJ80_03830 [Polytolypa hystricis UAMH7299]
MTVQHSQTPEAAINNEKPEIVESDSKSSDIETPKEAEQPEEEEEPIVTFKTWIVVAILSLGYGLSFWPIPAVAAIGSLMSAEFGEPTQYIWYIPAWTIAITICFMLCGANTDLLGRRWFLVMGNLICTIGHIITACAKTNNVVIAGLAISGFGAGNCQMAAFALPELLPNKWRHIGVVIADIAVFVAVVVAPVTARYGWELGSWWWNFAAVAIFQFISFLGLYFLYFPPAHPYGLPPRQLIGEIDYMGGLLFIAGCLPILMGIVWTNIYPASDPHVVAPLVVGFFFIICFALWETYGNVKHPLTPTHVFTSSFGRDFTAPAIALAIINMFYYSSSILWPTMIAIFYTDGGADWKYSVILSLPQGLAITFGGTLLAIFGSMIRNWHWQMTVSVFLMVLFGSLLALVTTTNKGLMVAFVFLSQTAYGWALYLAIAVAQMGVKHRDLGISGGIAGVFRFAAGSIGAAIYTTVLNNTVSKYTLRLVPPAAIAAGLPESKVADLLAVVSTPEMATSFSTEIALAATEAVKEAYVHGVRVVALVSMAFGIIGIVACLCCKDVEPKMTNKIEVYLENDELASRNKYH